MTKYIICLGDGMADEPIAELGEKTPLQFARTPNMDWISKHGQSGLVHTVPEGCHPGSDVANMGILGYDAREVYTGRGPIEAASLGIELPEGKVIFRCNLVSIEENKMKDFTSGHISTEEANQLIRELNQRCGHLGVKFHAGVGYRHIVIADEKYKDLMCVAPHDITDKDITNFLPKGAEKEGILELMKEAEKVLIASEINKKRREENKTEANSIWPWSQGKYPSLKSFKEQYGVEGGIITAVDLLKGLAKLSGLLAPDILGATGFVDTNYEEKLKASLEILDKRDFVYVHIEAPDEAGHMGDYKLKVKAIEDFDEKIVGPLLRVTQDSEEIKILVLPDHPTPCAIKTHTSKPVPFAIFYNNIEGDESVQYDEESVRKGKLTFNYPWELTNYFIK